VIWFARSTTASFRGAGNEYLSPKRRDMKTAQQLGTGTNGRTVSLLTSLCEEDTGDNSVRRLAMLLAFRTSSLQGKTTEREVPIFCASASAL